MRRILTAMTAASVFLSANPLVGEAQATVNPPARRDSILAAVRAYVDASNRADVQAIIDSYSKSANVSTAGLGEIRRGWEAIRAQADSIAGQEGLMHFSLGAIDVTSLGSGYALVVSSVVVRITTEQGVAQVRGALTVVLERVGGAWRVLHDHVSLPLE